MSNITAEYLERIATRLRAARESAGLSIGQAAKLSGLTPLQISGLENGIVPVEYVRFSAIDKLLGLYHITRDELEAEPLAPISDEDMLKKIKAGLVSDEAFGRWIKIDRQLAKSAQESE